MKVELPSSCFLPQASRYLFHVTCFSLMPANKPFDILGSNPSSPTHDKGDWHLICHLLNIHIIRSILAVGKTIPRYFKGRVDTIFKSRVAEKMYISQK
jgi:hypothetical protein